MWAVILFLISAVGWACLGRVDIVTVAHGKIIPSGRVKVVQSLESAIVRRVLVSDGQSVQAGQVLVELDSTIAAANEARIVNELHAARLDKARVDALVVATRLPDGTLGFTPPPGAKQAEIALQRRRVGRAHAEHMASTIGFDAQIAQAEAERAATLSQIQQLDATIPLITEQTQAVAKLLKSNHAARAQWLELERERIEQVKRRDVHKHRLVMQAAAVSATEQRKAVYQAQRETTLLAELSELDMRISSHEAELVKAKLRHSLQSLKAPTPGVVQQLAVHTVGGVVTPAQALMHIVPNDQRLIVEAWVENKDIGFVTERHSAEVKIDAFPFTRYGTIDAQIVMLSDDAIANESLGLVYSAHVKLSRSTMDVGTKEVPLSPGMTATVEVKTGKRRIIEFVLAPLLRGLGESARER
jgi:hemolysin D